jgi:hypothetical protein
VISPLLFFFFISFFVTDVAIKTVRKKLYIIYTLELCREETKMKKKILLVSIIAVALLLFMPSIPAIQQTTIEEKTYSDFVEKFEDFNLENNDDVKYPLLNALILFITDIMVDRWLRFMNISLDYVDGEYVITNPVIFVYTMWLWTRLNLWSHFWTILNDNNDWNWEWP